MNAIILASSFRAEFWDELLLRMATKLRFDEPPEGEALEQEDGKGKRKEERKRGKKSGAVAIPTWRCVGRRRAD
jgi:hypothetical protein